MAHKAFMRFQQKVYNPCFNLNFWLLFLQPVMVPASGKNPGQD